MDSQGREDIIFGTEWNPLKKRIDIRKSTVNIIIIVIIHLEYTDMNLNIDYFFYRNGSIVSFNWGKSPN